MMQVGLTGMGNNGFMNYVMQSQQNTDMLIHDFEQLIAAGYNPNTIKEQAFANRGISESDLTDLDKKRLQRKVEEIYQAYNSRRRY